jgi:hypothetical protein
MAKIRLHGQQAGKMRRKHGCTLSMIPKSGNRFSEKIMLKQKGRSGMTIQRNLIAL